MTTDPIRPRELPLQTHAVPPPPPPPPPSPPQRPSRWKRFLQGAGEVLDGIAAGSPAGLAQYAVNGIEEMVEERQAVKRGDPPPPPPPSKLRPDGTKKGFWERFDEAADEIDRTYHRDGLLADPRKHAEAEARIVARQERDRAAEELRSQGAYEAAREASKPHTADGQGLTREQYDRVVDEHEALARRMAAHPELFEAPPTGAAGEVVTSVSRVSPSVANRFPELADDAGDTSSPGYGGPSL